MNRKMLSRLFLLFLAWCCCSAATLSAQSNDTALGSAGEIYQARAGAYRDLFPGLKPPSGVDPASTVLALDVDRPGAAGQRLLVPSTAGSEVELLPSLIYESAANTVYLLWEKRTDGANPVLMLVSFNSNSGFSIPAELISDSFSSTTHPQIALTHDQYQLADSSGNNPVTQTRTVLHVLYTKDGASSVDTFYTPVVFENGVYIGRNPVYRLSSFDTSSPAYPGGYPVSPRLLHSPALSAGQDGRTVTIGFVSPATQNVLTLELDVLPASLGQVADKLRAVIVDLGRNKTATAQSVADQTRNATMAQGATSFRIDVLGTLADAAWAKIASSPDVPTEQLADSVHDLVISIGAEFSGRGLRTFADNAPAQISEVQVNDNSGAPNVPPSQLLRWRLTSSRPAPDIGSSSGETRMFVSETGERVIVSWLDTTGNQVFYRVSEGTTWGNPQVIKLSSALTLDNAYSILGQRARGN